MLIVTDPYGPGLDEQQSYWLYGGNDSIGTRQAFDMLYPQLKGDDLKLYNCAFAFQAACLAMTLRGVRVDEFASKEAIKQCDRDEDVATQFLNEHPTVQEVWDVRGKRVKGDLCVTTGKRHNWSPRGGEASNQLCKHCGSPRLVGTAFNPHSTAQRAHLLYDLLGLKVRYSRKNTKTDGTRSITTDEEAIEALANKYPEHADLFDRILQALGFRSQSKVLKSWRNTDGRWRSTFNVCAAKTGRMSSSKSPYERKGYGLQNIADKNRKIFIPDPGLVLFYADLEAAESTLVAWDAQCPQDIEDHANGDAHTGLAETLFPYLDWSGGPVRAIADGATPFATNSQNSTWRQIAKVTRHGTNIGMSATGVARQLHQPRSVGAEMRERYFHRYPENLARQLEIRRTVRDTGVLTGPVGNTRRFLGRLWEDDTQREALAQIQQSTVAWMLNLAMWRVWYELDNRLNLGSPPRPTDPNRVWLLGQVHDALLGLVRPGDLDTLRRVREIMELPILIHGHAVCIRTEIAIGKSWLHEDLKKVEL